MFHATGTFKRWERAPPAGRPAQRLACSIPRTGRPAVYFLTRVVTRWRSCWYDVGFCVLLYGWLVLLFIVVLCVLFSLAFSPLPWRLEQTSTYLPLSLSLLTQRYDTVVRIPFSRANHFFLFRIAWVKCNSNNLGRLCVVVACCPSQVALAQILSSFWWAVVHGSCTTRASPRPCAVHSSLVWFAHSSLIFARGARNLSGTSLQTVVTWRSSRGVSCPTVVATCLWLSRQSSHSPSCCILFLCLWCSQFRADTFVSLLLGLSVGSLGPSTIITSQHEICIGCISSLGPSTIITSQHDICIGCISFLSGPLVFLSQFSLRS